MITPHPIAARGPSRAGAFTLLETVLAVVLSSLVLMAAFGVMMTISMADRQLATDHRNVNELANTQTVLRRAFMNMRMDPDARTLPELTQAIVASNDNGTPPEDEDEPQDPQTFRIILERDTSPELTEAMRWASAGPISVARMPQRLEMVISPTPVPPRGGPSGTEFGSAVRGVFDLRPDGWREHKIRQARAALGELPPQDPEPPRADGWTLWWTPLVGAGVTITPVRYNAQTLVKDRVLPEPGQDGAILSTGTSPGASTGSGGSTGSVDPVSAAYLEFGVSPDSVPLVRGLASFEAAFFRQRVSQTELIANAEGDMPAYASVTLTTLSGRRAEWLFEVGWETGDDPMIIDDDSDLNQQIEGSERTIDGNDNGAGNNTRGGAQQFNPRRGGRGAGGRGAGDGGGRGG